MTLHHPDCPEQLAGGKFIQPHDVRLGKVIGDAHHGRITALRPGRPHQPQVELDPQHAAHGIRRLRTVARVPFSSVSLRNRPCKQNLRVT